MGYKELIERRDRDRQMARLLRLGRRNSRYFTYADRAGCPCCLSMFDVKNTVFRAVDEGETYICPNCGMDTLVTDNNGVRGVDLLFLDQELLEEIHQWLVNNKLCGLGEK